MFSIGSDNFYIYPAAVLLISVGVVLLEAYIKRFNRDNVTKIFKGFIIGLLLGAGFSAMRFLFTLE